MAGDWIKMRNNLWDDPRVSNLCDLTGLPEAMVIGGLYWLWASADEHSEDGHMPGLSVAGIDRKTGCKGLGAGLLSIGWIEDTPGGITILRFDEHNGKSAKRRCLDAQRKANDRNVSASDADIERTDGGRNAPVLGAREEKRREEERTPSLRSGEGAPKRAARKCPADFAVTDELTAWAAARFPAVDVAVETEKFRDHTFAKAIADWPGAWRNWVRRAGDFAAARPTTVRGGRSPPASPTDTAARNVAARRLLGFADETETIDA